jgi:hypothetical protein
VRGVKREQETQRGVLGEALRGYKVLRGGDGKEVLEID